MSLLWLFLFGLLYQIATTSNVTGSWVQDWQNAYAPSDNYATLTITEISGNSDNLTLAWETVGAPVTNSSSMTSVSTNVWTDSQNQQIVYNPATDTLTYNIKTAKYPYLFTRNGSFFSQQDVFGSLSGSWINPTPINSSTDPSVCCVPTGISFWANVSQSAPQNLSIFIYSKTSDCSSQVPALNNISLLAPSTETLTWSDNNSLIQDSHFQISLTPSNSLNQLQLMLHDDTDTVCGFYLYRSNTTQNLNGTWYRDWQTTEDEVYYSFYQVSTIVSSNISYMISPGVYQGFVTQSTISGEYSDPLHDLSYFYNNKTNTLLDTDYSALFSSNGSLFSSAPFIKTWSNPKSANGSSLDNCCVPTSILIQGQVNAPILSINYTLPENYSSQPACVDFYYQINSNMLESSIQIASPSIIQLTWTDYIYDSTISLVNATTNSQIKVSFLGECSFIMDDLTPLLASNLAFPIMMTLLLSVIFII